MKLNRKTTNKTALAILATALLVTGSTAFADTLPGGAPLKHTVFGDTATFQFSVPAQETLSIEVGSGAVTSDQVSWNGTMSGVGLSSTEHLGVWMPLSNDQFYVTDGQNKHHYVNLKTTFTNGASGGQYFLKDGGSGYIYYASEGGDTSGTFNITTQEKVKDLAGLTLTGTITVVTTSV